MYDYVNIMTEYVAIVSALAKGGAFLDWQDENGNTSLHLAACFHHVNTSKILLQAGADKNLRDYHGASPSHVAALTGCEAIVVGLIEAGADLEPRMVGDYFPLHVAAMKNRVNVSSVQLDAGGTTEHRDAFHGRTPLSWACKACLAPIVRVLVEAGADIEPR